MSGLRLLPGRGFDAAAPHAVLGTLPAGPHPQRMQSILLGMGCFWGAERLFWNLGEGVHATAVGYAGGTAPDPGYEAVCTGRTGHTEVVLLVWDPRQLGLARVLDTFWREHDPTQGMRQGNDIGSQYRSCLYCTSPAQLQFAQHSAQAFQQALSAGPSMAMGAAVTTQIAPAGDFYFAEDHHQQYLHKVPHGYCGLAGTGVRFAMPEEPQEPEAIVGSRQQPQRAGA